MPSKALLAVSGRMRELQNEHHMKSFGLQVINHQLMFSDIKLLAFSLAC